MGQTNRTAVGGAAGNVLRCPGTLPRRSFLRTGAVGLTLADLLRAQATGSESSAVKSDKSMIVLWLWGGPSHLETFDMKPEAPLEYRGEFRPIRTNVSGIEICEHLPRLAARADRFSLIRSLSHDSPGHVNSTHTLVTAYPGELNEMPPYEPKHPNAWSVITKLLGQKRPDLPAHVANHVRYDGAAYLGHGLQPFLVTADPNLADFRVANVGIEKIARERFQTRAELLAKLDQFRRDLDTHGHMQARDQFNQSAIDMLVSDAALRAFDISQESDETRDRYGRNTIGQRCLLARRLVEAGVRLVTIDFPYVAGQKAKSWDDHASVWNIFDEMRVRLPVLDQVVSALIDDLHSRGMERDVLLLVMGEMSHTPLLSNYNGQPGREHWGKAMSVFMSGGGLQMGQVIGSTNARGEEPQSNPVTPNDFLATLYRAMGVPLETQFKDHSGRPVSIVPDGEPIQGLF
ncbi:MAG: DUF1501 domain-containing protein [Pirellulaceae bacterium]|nr:DUF1501 domain-containing protein [Pirellulaceae bacterium]